MRFVQSLLIATLGILLASVEPRAESSAVAAAPLTIEISGLRGNEGSLAYALYDSPLAYEERSQPVRAGFVPVEAKKQLLIVEDLSPGTYAAMFYQDRNGNGALDRNVLGKPSEPYGFSQNARARFGPPEFAEASFVFEAEMGPLEVRLR